METLPFIAGSPALDFVNTAEERGHPLCGDVLLSPADLQIWGYRYGVIDQTASSNDRHEELARSIDARELLYRLWFSRVHGGPDDPHDLLRLARFVAEAHAAGALQSADDGRLAWHWKRSDLASIRHLAVASAVDLLTAPGRFRLKQCPGDHCGWFFLDTTKQANRRWCQMSKCGQAAKTAGRRQRAAEASS